MGMMVPFNFDGAAIRVLEIDGDPWFVGKDVAEALGYSNPRKALLDHCKKAQAVGESRFVTPSDLDPQTKIIPEGDVYRLIVRSKLPSAERFEALVMEEILPTIRKTGSYGAPISLSGPQLMAAALIEADATMKAQAQQIEEMREDVQALEKLAKADGSLNITEVAKNLGLRPKDLFSWLSSNGWIYKRAGSGNWLGYQTKCNTGLLEHKSTTVLRADGSEKVTEQVRVTAKGLTHLAKLIPGVAKEVAA